MELDGEALEVRTHVELQSPLFSTVSLARVQPQLTHLNRKYLEACIVLECSD